MTNIEIQDFRRAARQATARVWLDAGYHIYNEWIEIGRGMMGFNPRMVS